MRSLNHRYFAAAGLFFLLASCGDSTSAPVPNRIVVTPGTVVMESLGETQQFSARIEDDRGQEMTGIVLSWSTSDASVASVSDAGLATGLKAGAVDIRASAEGLTGRSTLRVDPIPQELTKVTGDGQTGILQAPLPVAPTIEVRDAAGNPLPDVNVTFAVIAGEGTVSQGFVKTDAQGRASTVWQLGCSNVSPQILEANASGLNTFFTATPDLSQLAICPQEIPDGRVTHAYVADFESAGGQQGTVSWSVAAGSLPAGLTLASDGILAGVPEEDGGFSFQVQAQDGGGSTATLPVEFEICEAPLALAPGQSQVLTPSGTVGCGFYLPAGGSGDRYRFGVLYAVEEENENDVTSVSVSMIREADPVPAPPSPTATRFFDLSGPALDAVSVDPMQTAAIREALQVERTTAAFHRHLREMEREMIREMGPNVRPLPDSPKRARVSGALAPAPEKISFRNSVDLDTSSRCTEYNTVRAVKIAESDDVVIYQDSIQNVSRPVSPTYGQQMADYYTSYGKEIIERYFGGVTDINSDGRIVVFITPVVESGTAAYVWNGDFFPRTAPSGSGQCPASNEMELIRFSVSTVLGLADQNYQALATVVHEAKHLSSLYNGLIRDFEPYYHPGWVEEGTAEIAAEMSSRLAWESIGGPAVGAMASQSDNVAWNPEFFGVLLRSIRAVGYLTSQPNSVVVDPNGASEYHSVYGSGWHFHRWLGDAYGNASERLGDADLFQTLNDSLTAAGITGIQGVTGGKEWVEILEEYLAAVMLSGQNVPQGPTSFSTYDFPSLIRGINIISNYGAETDGDYPWPVNVFGANVSSPFATVTNTGFLGPSGIRVFDVTSDGTGLGMEVRVSTPFVTKPVRIVVVRVQ